MLNCEKVCKKVADKEGFEPSVPLPVRILSRDVVSASSPTCPCSSVKGLKLYVKEVENRLKKSLFY